MPTRFNTNFLRLQDDTEFEELLRDICVLEWHDSGTERNGRRGQSQWGVDVYGRPSWLGGDYYGVQCKLRPSQKQLTENQIEQEVEQARDFPHRLAKLIIATDTPRDNQIQILVDRISEREQNNDGFAIEVWFWPEIERKIATYPRILVKFYHDHLTSLTNTEVLNRLVDRPLKILSIKSPTLDDVTSLDQRLQFRGVQITDDVFSPVEAKAVDYNELLPDGIIYYVDGATNPNIDTTLIHLASTVLSWEKLVEPSCPECIVFSPDQRHQLMAYLRNLNVAPSRFLLLPNDLDVNEIADRVFSAIFDYGYKRRGAMPTINVSARTRSNKPLSALLDLDWHSRLSTKYHPAVSEWDEFFVPALTATTSKLVGLKEATRVQIDSDLPVPASVALGFFLNLRVAILGVWARKIGKSDDREFWLSDGVPAKNEVVETWFKDKQIGVQSAILELTTGFAIHESVITFIEQQNLAYDIWLQAHLPASGSGVEPAGIDEAKAIAYANHVGSLVRKLTERGVTDTHLFLRVPTALGVFLGQKLHACGRIHLYWFDNKNYSYKPAFMLA